MSTGVRHAICVVAATLLQASLALAATPPAGQIAEQDEELEEVVVSAAKIVRNERDILNWLKRLVGQHSYEGYVELGGEGAPDGRRTAGGMGKCVPINFIAVLCEARVSWRDIKAEDGSDLPGGVSMLKPAVTMYGFDEAIRSIRSLQVDSGGMANGGRGELRGDTLITTTDCVDLPGDCKRVSRVSAQPGGKVIRMEIEIERDGSRVAHYVFQLRKVAEVSARKAQQ